MATTQNENTAEKDPAAEDRVLKPHQRAAGDIPTTAREDRAETEFDRREATDRLLSQAERVLTEVRKLGSVASETAGDAFGSAKHAGVDAVDSGRERVRDARSEVEAYVERQPLKALLIAAGVGAVLGIWSRR